MRARSGFSLIESMIVVAIVGLMAAAVMPAMVEMIASNRQHAAAVDIKTLAVDARAAAVLKGKFAYALVFQQLSGGGNGAVQVVTGVTGHCNRSTGVPINSIWDVVTPPIGWQSSLASMDMRERSFGSHRVFATMELPESSVQGQMRICYAASGETHVYGAGLPGGGGEQAQAAVMRIRRENGGRAVGVPREVVFMPGGTARLR
jgi:prepilin-type N-terminal cleavage/methylation domain-containing protein